MSTTSRITCGATALAIALALPTARSAAAQVVEPRTAIEHLEIGGRVHLQFNTTSVDGEPGSEFLLRRARIWVNSRVNDWIDGVVELDFGRGKASLRSAFLRLWLDDAFQLSFGQFKRPFDMFELTSSSEILVIERAGSIRGADACGDLSGVCSYSHLGQALQFSSRDIGVLATGNAGAKVNYSVSVTNGTGLNETEENGTKSLSGRVEYTPIARLRLGVNVAAHDFPNAETGQDEYAPAVGLDASWGNFEQGPHLRWAVMAGDNWRSISAAGEAGGFRATQALFTYRLALAGTRVRALEPLFRVSLADPDVDTADDGGVLYTPGLIAHLEGRNKLAANLDVWSPSAGDAEWSLKFQAYLYF